MLLKTTFIFIGSILGYFFIFLFFPLLWIQGIYLKKVVLRLPTPRDSPFGKFKGNKGVIKILGIGESTMAGVGIINHAETLTGLTAQTLSQSIGSNVDWRIIAQNGLTLKNLNKLLIEKKFSDIDLIFIAVGGNDVFNLTAPWVWRKDIINCLKILKNYNKSPLIIFSPVPCVGRFPAIPKPLSLVFGYWEFLLQEYLSLVVCLIENVQLLEERFPDGEEFFMSDGIHPSALSYKLWSTKLSTLAIEYLQKYNSNSAQT